ncbi:MAG: DJ-1/PfpI family protein [Ruminococcaceae bacterium]|nr:DJ-1/PfpI family protein [Oscillospiraceae bacterium]
MNYIFLADGFEEIEALTVVDILRRLGLDIATVSITESRTVVGTHSIPVTADLCLCDAALDEAAALILPGGLPGADNLQACKPLAEALCRAAKDGRIVAAICAAPRMLGALGLVSGKKATCYPGCEGALTGAHYVTDRVVIDDNIITSRGPATASDFAFALAEALGADTTALRSGMLYA